MAHKNNKNIHGKVNNKTKKELKKMLVETGNEIGYSKESKKLGHDEPRPEELRSKEARLQEIKDIMKFSKK
ncbi:hypothetical protein [Clostridium cellulovorans]|uniref:Small, acid-soluble spore protein, alpha/beta type n=1 Tax=Clostridium cellulovorans (strain ATCC 35296 / DSM 3052 / OCM 3 / 743B) TaxID=573061 RepID=D9SL29_CLOC7|nr:hypothetical protein [Clostridium cellulovorans]ADL51545.1 hypothetical protein Clocel_1801 [Clostridium cellulovorans 743B]